MKKQKRKIYAVHVNSFEKEYYHCFLLCEFECPSEQYVKDVFKRDYGLNPDKYNFDVLEVVHYPTFIT